MRDHIKLSMAGDWMADHIKLSKASNCKGQLDIIQGYKFAASHVNPSGFSLKNFV